MSLQRDIADYIRSGESANRNLGLEIEHFIIDNRGVQITFDEISPLIDEVSKTLGAEIIYMDGYPVGYYTGEYSTSLEPAWQFEISINPYNDISEIERIYREFRDLWEPIFAARGYHFEEKGNLPLVERGLITPDDIPLSPKKRYKYMNAYFEKSGSYGKYMMRASASTQISIDYKSEADMVRKLTVLEKISPILMIMMENKTDPNATLPGKEHLPHLFRTQQWDDLDPARTGFVPHSLDAGFGYDKMAEVIMNTPLILLTDEGATTDVGSKTAKDLIADGTINYPDADDARKKRLIEHFMSMGFFHYRVKKYIEIRVADSVPIRKALGYVALIKGLIYSEKNLDFLAKALSSVTTADEIEEAVVAIEADGLAASVFNGMSAGAWADQIFRLAASELSKKDKEYLNGVRTVWNHSEKENTDQRTA